MKVKAKAPLPLWKTVVLEAADCFRCAYRHGRSRVDPDLVGCENKRAYANYHTVKSEGCNMFKEATESELRRIAMLDNMELNKEWNEGME